MLDGFVFNYQIPQIGQEFDALKISKECMLDIELKSIRFDKDKAKKQLIRNRHYLRGVSNKPIQLFSFFSSGNELYSLSGSNELVRVGWTDLLDALQSALNPIKADYDNLFHPSKYLVPPINEPEAFFKGTYFLTNHQSKIENLMMKYFDSGESGGFILSGGPGTGKTLVLYDIAKQMAKHKGGKSCIVHCGVWSEVHDRFNSLSKSIQLVHAKNVGLTNFKQFVFVGIDETQRVHENTLARIIEQINSSDQPFIACIDQGQTMTVSEERRSIIDELTRIIPSERVLSLGNKFRTNPSLLRFINKLFDNNTGGSLSKECISIVNTHTIEATKEAVSYYCSLGYQHISLSSALHERSYLDDLQFPELGSISSHRAIGQEFESVVMVIPSCFHYDHSGTLSADSHPYSDYQFKKLLYQGLTRARNKLALVFFDNQEVFHSVLTLFEEC